MFPFQSFWWWKHEFGSIHWTGWYRHAGIRMKNSAVTAWSEWFAIEWRQSGHSNGAAAVCCLCVCVCACYLCLMTPIPYVVCCKASRWSRSRKSCWKPGAGSDWPYHAAARPAIAIHGLHESQCTQLQRHLDVRTLHKDKSCRFSIEPRITCRTPKPWRLRDFQL